MEIVRKVRPNRKITGMSAILLPFTPQAEIDWPSFDRHLLRTVEAGLTPAVNMDTGYVNLLSASEISQVLQRTKDLLKGKKFIAGAFVGDQAGAPFASESYLRAIDQITSAGGTPIIFQSHGLTSLPSDELIQAYEKLGTACDEFLAFELGKMFAPFGKIYDLATYERLLQIKNCRGAKHSSLSRIEEWARLDLRDRVRPDFLVLTGNDLAIDMIQYGSDYLLGLSSFAPDQFALRDRYWLEGDSRFYELNDWLQYLGFLAFRAPVPAYKHSCAQFLKLRGWLPSDTPHPKGATRPASDIELLRLIADHFAGTLS